SAPPPFTIALYGVAVTDPQVNPNGILRFGASPGSARSGCSGASVAFPTNSLGVFVSDLQTPTTGGCAATTATVPRKYVVTWSNVGPLGNSTPSYTFSVVFTEGSPQIEFQYGTMTGTGADGSASTIGIQGPAGTATRYACMQGV